LPVGKVLRDWLAVSGLVIGADVEMGWEAMKRRLSPCPPVRSRRNRGSRHDLLPRAPQGSKGRDASHVWPRPADDNPKLNSGLPIFGASHHAVCITPGAPLMPRCAAAFLHADARLGVTCVVMERIDPLGALAAVERHHVNHSQRVAAMFVRFLPCPKRTTDASSWGLMHGHSFGRPVPEAGQAVDD
jgi:hypothetical protein